MGADRPCLGAPDRGALSHAGARPGTEFRADGVCSGREWPSDSSRPIDRPGRHQGRPVRTLPRRLSAPGHGGGCALPRPRRPLFCLPRRLGNDAAPTGQVGSTRLGAVWPGADLRRHREFQDFRRRCLFLIASGVQAPARAQEKGRPGVTPGRPLVGGRVGRPTAGRWARRSRKPVPDGAGCCRRNRSGRCTRSAS